LTPRERFRSVMNFGPVDRLPCLEWAPYWKLTLERWRREGLPENVDPRDWFQLDRHALHIISPVRTTAPRPHHHGAGLVESESDYEAFLQHLYPDPEEAVDSARFSEDIREQTAGDTVLWISLLGFFWFPRVLFGIEKHLYAFYDQPALMHRMNQDLLQFNLRCANYVMSRCVPDLVYISEDMSYNHGAMISRQQFDEFLAPYYRLILSPLKKCGVPCFVDTDGFVEDIIPWFLEVGIDGFLPIERQAGNDVARIRRTYPRLRLVGGFDKTVMHRGEAAIRAEFERLLPVMRSGGFLVGVDHQTPPEVSLNDYALYVQLLKEYCALAGQASAPTELPQTLSSSPGERAE